MLPCRFISPGLDLAWRQEWKQRKLWWHVGTYSHSQKGAGRFMCTGNIQAPNMALCKKLFCGNWWRACAQHVHRSSPSSLGLENLWRLYEGCRVMSRLLVLSSKAASIFAKHVGHTRTMPRIPITIHPQRKMIPNSNLQTQNFASETPEPNLQRLKSTRAC